MIEILAGGPQTTVQDVGRFGYGASGVPSGGAMDTFALRAANLLVGNIPSAAGIETLLGGLALRFLDSAWIAITGADLGAQLDAAPAPLWTTLPVHTGSELRWTERKSGARAYLAVAGGIVVPPVLGSASTYLPAGWGGVDGHVLREGDRLAPGAFDVQSVRQAWLPPEHRPPYNHFPTLRCVPGPHLDLFEQGSLQQLCANDYTLSPACDRMGYRLDGFAPMTIPKASVPSLGVLPGCVQVPPGGQPILLMADAQTTGGYPTIASVISADLPLAAQLLPGDRLRFRPVSINAATGAVREQQRWLDELTQVMEIMGSPV